MRVNDNQIYALALDQISSADLYTFAHLFYTKDEWRIKKSGSPNCVLQTYEGQVGPSRFRVLVSVCGLTKLKVDLYVESSDYLAVKDNKMRIVRPGEGKRAIYFIPLVQVLEAGGPGQVVWAKWI